MIGKTFLTVSDSYRGIICVILLITKLFRYYLPLAREGFPDVSSATSLLLVVICAGLLGILILNLFWLSASARGAPVFAVVVERV